MTIAQAQTRDRALSGPVAMIVVAAVLFSLPALYNGFPFVFSGDTPWYLFLTSHPMRTPYYSLLILPLHWHVTLWPVVFGQALLLAHLLYLTERVAFGAVEPPRYLALCLILTLCTSLPWFVGLILPDIFTGVLVLASFLLAFGLDRLSRLEIAYVFLLQAGSITLHLSNLPLAVGLLLVALVYKVLVQRQTLLRLAPVALQGGAVALAAAALLLSSLAIFGSLTLSPGGKVFLMARSIADGPGLQYLQESCPEKRYRLCGHLETLEPDADYILWRPEGPVQSEGGPEAMIEEADAVFSGAVERYPLWHLQAAVGNFAEQLVTFDTGAELTSYLWRLAIGRAIEKAVPGSIEGYSRSKQSLSELPLPALRLIGQVTAAVSLGLVAWLQVLQWRRRDWQGMALVVMVLAALLGNALISGAGSGPYDRYQSRVIWLLTFVAIAGLLHVLPGKGAARRPGS